jgi:hypothetical protein
MGAAAGDPESAEIAAEEYREATLAAEQAQKEWARALELKEEIEHWYTEVRAYYDSVTKMEDNFETLWWLDQVAAPTKVLKSADFAKAMASGKTEAGLVHYGKRIYSEKASNAILANKFPEDLPQVKPQLDAANGEIDIMTATELLPFCKWYKVVVKKQQSAGADACDILTAESAHARKNWKSAFGKFGKMKMGRKLSMIAKMRQANAPADVPAPITAVTTVAKVSSTPQGAKPSKGEPTSGLPVEEVPAIDERCSDPKEGGNDATELEKCRARENEEEGYLAGKNRRSISVRKLKALALLSNSLGSKASQAWSRGQLDGLSKDDLVKMIMNSDCIRPTLLEPPC